MPENPFLQYVAPSAGVPLTSGNPKLSGEIVGQGLNNQGQALTNQRTAAELPNIPLQRENIRTNIAQGQNSIQNTKLDNVNNMRKQFEALQGTQDYRTILPQAASAFRAKDNKAGDLDLIYAFGKIMDPNSVVREGELNMATGVGGVAERVKGYIASVNGKGRLTPEQRHSLLDEIRNRGGALADAYNQSRSYYKTIAQKNGIDPDQVVGPHPGQPFQPAEAAYLGRPIRNLDGGQGAAPPGYVPPQQAPTQPPETAQPPVGNGPMEVNVVGGHDPSEQEMAADPKLAEAWGYRQSALGQGLSGVNEGIANAVGAPVDLAAGAINLGTRGINALANTNIPTLDKSFLGSQWLKENVLNKTIFDPTNDPTNQFVRRVGQSVGGALIPAGMAGSMGRAGLTLAGGVGGGLGAATAQQVAPGNVGAEMAGEMLGGAGGAAGALNMAKRGATRAVEAAVPTIEDLKAQAGSLYRQAEARGVVADGQATRDLSDGFRQVLEKEGRISPEGRVSDVYPKGKEAFQLVQDYAGKSMSPTQMQTVRSVATDGLASAEPAERRMGRLLTDTFDEWATPRAPELEQARGISSRYITAEQLAKARELATASTGQYSGSGFENALRTQYRALDKKEVKDQMRFTPDLTRAIQVVNRGTTGSNIARGVGKLAPTGVVSMGLGSMLPGAMAAGGTGSAPVGAAVGGGLAGLGILGRAAATHMGLRAAEKAELIARNGAALNIPNQLTPEAMRALGLLGISEAGNYSAR